MKLVKTKARRHFLLQRHCQTAVAYCGDFYCEDTIKVTDNYEAVNCKACLKMLGYPLSIEATWSWALEM